MPERDADWYLRRGLSSTESFGYFLETCAGFWPDREVVSFEGARYTYDQLHQWSLAAAQLLVDKGLRPGDRVMIQALNSIELLAVQFAAWRVGAITVPIVPMYRAHELKTILREVSPKIVASSGKIGSRCYCSELDELFDEMGQAPAAKIILASPAYRPGWTPVPPAPAPGAAVDGRDLPEAAAGTDCAVILYTSGSTAAPKGAMLRSSAIVNSARAFQKSMGIGQADVALCATPLGHTGALINGMIVPMSGGARGVVLPSWKPDEALEVIAREKVTIMSAPPLILQDLVERYETVAPSGHRLQRFYGGGGPVPPSLIQRADAVGIRAIRAYGMTETTGNFTICHTDESFERRALFDGRPLYGCELAVVDEERRALPQGGVGEVRVRGPNILMGYVDKAATQAAIDVQGWFYTGDLGRIDADGWLTIEGRVKDIINRGGEKFSSQDIEAAIASHPDITDVAVVGAPDPRYGEVVAAFIRLKPQVVWSGPEKLLEHLEAAKLAKPKRPVHWHVLDEFPRTPSGKVQKQALRAMQLGAQADGPPKP
jgi:acyl-CoA synthetase (AMP-forming)/AMP-acid ligase II